MAKHLLTNVSAKAIKEPGRHADGDGLYLVVDSYGKRWVLLFQWQGRRREMGLGRFQDVSLAKAREKAAEAAKVIGGSILIGGDHLCRVLSELDRMEGAVTVFVKAFELENPGVENKDDDWVWDELRAVGLAYLQARAALNPEPKP